MSVPRHCSVRPSRFRRCSRSTRLQRAVGGLWEDFVFWRKCYIFRSYGGEAFDDSFSSVQTPCSLLHNTANFSSNNNSKLSRIFENLSRNSVLFLNRSAALNTNLSSHDIAAFNSVDGRPIPTSNPPFLNQLAPSALQTVLKLDPTIITRAVCSVCFDKISPLFILFLYSFFHLPPPPPPYEWWDACCRSNWPGLFFFFFCYQPSLIWAFCFINFPILLPLPPRSIRNLSFKPKHRSRKPSTSFALSVKWPLIRLSIGRLRWASLVATIISSFFV